MFDRFSNFLRQGLLPGCTYHCPCCWFIDTTMESRKVAAKCQPPIMCVNSVSTRVGTCAVSWQGQLNLAACALRHRPRHPYHHRSSPHHRHHHFQHHLSTQLFPSTVHESYDILSNFALIEYVLECASDVCFCMKLPKTIGDSQKKRYVLPNALVAYLLFKSRGVWSVFLGPFVQPW